MKYSWILAILLTFACGTPSTPEINEPVSKPKPEPLIQKPLPENYRCSFSMRQIKSGTNNYIAVTGLRYCPPNYFATQEVILYKRGESINNKAANVFVSNDTINAIDLRWANDTLVVQQNNRSEIPLMEATEVDGVQVKYVVIAKMASIH